MSPDQIALIRESWSTVERLGPGAAELFYRRLFKIDSSLGALFVKTDMAHQHTKLMAAISTAVASLNDLPALIDVLKALGARHAGYGVEPAHYDTVGEALLWTLEQGLQADWTEEVAAAWTEIYQTMAAVMQSAAEGEIAA